MAPHELTRDAFIAAAMIEAFERHKDALLII
jgi:hypothetical protein